MGGKLFRGCCSSIFGFSFRISRTKCGRSSPGGRAISLPLAIFAFSLCVALVSGSPYSPYTVNGPIPEENDVLCPQGSCETKTENFESGTEIKKDSKGTGNSLKSGALSNLKTKPRSNFKIKSGSNLKSGVESNNEIGTENNLKKRTESNSRIGTRSNLKKGGESNNEIDAGSNPKTEIESSFIPGAENILEHARWEDIYRQPTADEKERIKRFDPSRLNYTALHMLIDEWASSSVEREGRLLGENHIPGFLSSLGRFLDFEQVVKEVETSIMSSVSCNACKAGMGLLQHYINTKKSKAEIIYAASKLCSTFKIESPRVCYGIINLMADEVIYVAKNVFMTPDQVCSFVIGDICGHSYNPYHDWRVMFPPVPKPLFQHPTAVQQTGRPVMKVLQLSDTHFDPEYMENTNAECGEPLCCRLTSGFPRSKKQAAGYWGDYRKCDTPERTIFNMFENIAYLHPDLDYILWTGDLPPHDVWNQTKEANTNVLRETVKQLLEFFPNTPIFPALGNHESAPVNSFPPPYVPNEFGVGWLYKELHDQWRRWLPQETSSTILKGGFYSVLVKPKFRIISINTNFCNNKNWWLLVNSTDPAQELQWLIYELQGAEIRGEKVHVIGHIPPGHNDCLKVWSHNYYSIINRYESTISAQFFGHTHYDEFEVFYDEYRPERALNVAYIGPSVTSYYGLNPGYRIYMVEGDFEGSTKAVLDHETWVMNLQEANNNGRPRWYQLYSAKKTYGLRTLHPQEWDSLIYRMTEDDKLFKLYHRFYWKDSPEKESCNKDCKKRMLCDLKSGRSNDRQVTCAKVKEKVEAEERTSWGGWLFSGLTVTSLATWWLWG